LLSLNKAWGHDYVPDYPEVAKKNRDKEARQKDRDARRHK
jgi:hypothetical protein